MFVKISPAVRRAVVVAPTGAGKTTAVLQNLEHYLKEYNRVFLTFPTKSLMYEVSRKLTDRNVPHLLDNSDARLTRNISVHDWMTNRVIVSSYEKLDSVLLMYPEIARNSLIVIDEVHLATDDERALAILSLMATARRVGAGIIVMSATVPNYAELAEYLDAEVIQHATQSKKKIIIEDIGSAPRGTAAYLYILSSVIEKHLRKDVDEYGRVLPTIIFRPSRKQCEIIAATLRERGFDAHAYHAGVPAKDKVELLRKFNEGKIDVLVSTHALCWGVNTPAMRVIIAGSLIYRYSGPQIFLKTVDVMQMAGRAGRPAYLSPDVVPEVVIITTSSYLNDSEFLTEKDFFEQATRGQYSEKIGIKGSPDTIIIRLLKAGRVKTAEDVREIPLEWFNVPPVSEFTDALERLIDLKLVHRDGESLELTRMGEIVAEQYLNIKAYMALKAWVIDRVSTDADRLTKLTSVCAAVAALNTTTLTVPSAAMDDPVILSIDDDDAREVAAQLVSVTGDTDRIAEEIKNYAFFLDRAYNEVLYPEKPTEDWRVLGKTMRRLRSMVYNGVPIKGVLGMYIDRKIDEFFSNAK